MIAGYRQFNDLLDEAYGSENQEDIDHFKSLTEGLKDSIFETAQELQEQQSNIADYYNTIKDIPYDDLTTEQKGIVDSYNSISDAIELIYQQLDSNTWKSMQIESVFDTDGIEKTKEELIEMVKAGEFDESTLQSYPKLSAALEQNKVSASELRNELEALADAEGNIQGDVTANEMGISLSITDTITQLNTQLKPTFDSLKSAYQDIFTTDDNGKPLFTLENVDLSMLDSIKSAIDDINKNEDLNIHIDYSEYENLARVLTDTSSTADDVHNAFDSFATDIVGALNPAISSCTGENYKLVKSLLESMGIVNAEAVMISSMGYSYDEYTKAKEECTDAGRDLADMTEEEINEFIMEQVEAGNSVEALANLQLKKLLVNDTKIDTSSDIQQIMNLASAAGVGADVLGKLAAAKSVLATVESGKYIPNDVIQTVLSNVEDARQSMLDWEPAKVEFSPKNSSKSKKSGSKSEKDTTKEFDWIEQAIENVEKEISNLNNIVNSAYSTFSQKNEALAKEIGKVSEEIQLQQQAYDEYMRKADSIGLSDDYKTLIHDGAINIENISNEKLQKKISEYQSWYEKAVSASDAVSELSTKVKDLHVAGYELQADRIAELLDNEAITEKQYLSEMKKLYKEYYENQVEYAQKAHEAKMALLDREKQYLNSVANAATSLLDKEIDKVQDNAKEQQKPYEDQIKAAEKQIDAYQDQIKVFEKQIDAHNKQIDAYNKEIDLINDRKKPLQDELDALEDKAREENLILDLQEKQYARRRAENQNDKLVNYMPDTIVI